MEGLDVAKLADLLSPENEDSDSEDELAPKSRYAKLGPGDFGPKSKTNTQEKATGKQSNSKEIWDSEEIQEGAEFDDLTDPRQQPEYDIVYKQSVSSEDMYLQMGNKTPSTASCEEMVVKINLPDTKMADVSLDVKEKFLDCRTPKYKLGLHLPFPVDHKNGQAKWDGNTSTLSVGLRMVRDYDFMNF